MSEFDWTEFESDKWSPDEIGDEIKGTIIDVRKEDGVGGNVVPVLTVDVDGHEREVWASPTILKQKLSELNPQKGDLVRIKLTDLKAVGRPQPMKVFAVAVKKAESELEKPAHDPEEDTF